MPRRDLVYLAVIISTCICLPVVELIENTEAAANLSRLNTEYFEWRMSERPEASTYRGYHRYNDILESYTIEGYNVSKAKADEYLIQLRSIPRDDLSSADKLNYDILDDMLTTFIEGFQWRLYNAINPLNFMEGPQRNPVGFTSFFPFYTIGDYEDYLTRLKRFPHQLDEYIVLFREAIRLKTAYNNVSMNLVLSQISSIEAACPPGGSMYTADCAYYEPFTDDLEKILTISAASKVELRSRGVTAVNDVMARYRDFKIFLQTEYMPASRTGYGVVNLENGREYYQACLKWYLSLDIPPEEVHNIGKQEVGRIEAEMKKIMMKTHFHGTVAEYFALLKNDSRMFFNSSEEMLEEYRNLITNRIDPHLNKLFNDNPNLPILVKPLSSDGPAGRYSRGSKDGSIPGIFWANVLRPSGFPKFAMLPLTMHEANPGHHLQISYNLITETPDFRSKMETSGNYRVPFAFPSYTAFIEGWALYAESLGEELNIYKDDNEMMGRYSSEIFRACRLVVDTGIHYYNWTKEEGVDYILMYTTKSRADVTVEVDRYITWPGQACAYKIGELKIKELRKLAEDRLGDKFDIREFHTSMMKNGIVPLNLLERNVKEWIEEQLTSQPEPESSYPITCSAQINSISVWILYIPLTLIYLLSNNVLT